MSRQPEQITVSAEGLTLSLIIWRRFHEPRPGLVEQILAINPGLAALGPVLPRGTVFLMPVEPSPNAGKAGAPIISLWD